MYTLNLTEEELCNLRRVLALAENRDNHPTILYEGRCTVNQGLKSKLNALLPIKAHENADLNPTMVFRVYYCDEYITEHRNVKKTHVVTHHDLVFGEIAARERKNLYSASGRYYETEEWITLQEYKEIESALLAAAHAHYQEFSAAFRSVTDELFKRYPKDEPKDIAALAYLAGIATGKRIERQRKHDDTL